MADILTPATASISPVTSGAVFSQQEGAWFPTVLSRGPWDERAQHGGAPCALLAHVAESSMEGEGWQLSRLSAELIRPVPVAPLTVRTDVHPARSTARITIDLCHDDVIVARGHVLMVRGQALQLAADLPGWSPDQLRPAPSECHGRVQIPGMPDGVSFFHTAMDCRLAQGNPGLPGPAAAWFRLNVPLVHSCATSPAMRAAAAADSGSGISWVLGADRYLFSNADLSLHLYRPPIGEWVGLISETQVHEGGVGVTLSRLYDLEGPVGVATQTLVLRERVDRPKP